MNNGELIVFSFVLTLIGTAIAIPPLLTLAANDESELRSICKPRIALGYLFMLVGLVLSVYVWWPR